MFPRQKVVVIKMTYRELTKQCSLSDMSLLPKFRFNAQELNILVGVMSEDKFSKLKFLLLK